MTKAKYLLFLAVSGAIIALDQLTKLYIHTQFRLHESVTVIDGYFNIAYVRNPGAAFGFLAKAPEIFRDNFFLVLPPIAMIIIVMMLRKVAENDKIQILALSLVFGGAIGNYIDRLQFGYVIDFLEFHIKEIYTWPNFNIADSAIVTGICILILLMFLEQKRKKV
jgi:signal peptidase II